MLEAVTQLSAQSHLVLLRSVCHISLICLVPLCQEIGWMPCVSHGMTFSLKLSVPLKVMLPNMFTAQVTPPDSVIHKPLIAPDNSFEILVSNCFFSINAYFIFFSDINIHIYVSFNPCPLHFLPPSLVILPLFHLIHGHG